MSTLIRNTERYAHIGGNQHTVICRDCSTRSNGVTIPTHEQNAHEIWHEYLDHVLRGVALLDEHRPDWRTRVDLDHLDMESAYLCILGQVYMTEYRQVSHQDRWHNASPYIYGLHQLGIAEESIVYMYGFCGSDIRDLAQEYQTELLTEHWAWQVSF